MIQVVGAENVIGGLEQVARNLGEERMTETMVEVNLALQEYHTRTWGRGVKDVPETKVRHPDSDLKLSETGALKKSLTSYDAPGAIRIATPSESIYGTSQWYAIFGQKGTKNEKRKPTLKFSTSVRRMIRELISGNVWKGAGDIAKG